MSKLFRELRRREVFRTLGLYVGISWILIEAANIFLPTFGAPIWMLQGLIIVAVIGFPIAAVLAWVYDITESGIERDADHPQTAAPAFGRKMDFVVIGLLAVALVFSVYLNLTTRVAVPTELQPITVLIADFENRTGESVFDGVVEQALNIGIEGAPHISAYDRRAAESLARELQPDTTGLTTAAAELVALRQGVDVVLAGTIEPAGRGFELSVAAHDPMSGDVIFDAVQRADTRDAVLAAIGTLAETVREGLGDDTVDQTESATAETFSAASIDAARSYMDAIELAFAGKHEEAVVQFKAATDLDPNFGRAYSGWALSEFKLGHENEARYLWDRALSLMSTMTERERLRTLGVYYATVTRNYEQAEQNFAELVEKFPADTAGRNNLAVSAFLALDFEIASAEGRRVMEIFPESQLYRSNFALYAMYSGDFEAAATEAGKLIESDPEYGTSYLPLAIARLAAGDYDAARAAYEGMARATASEHRASLATLGLADMAIYRGQLDEARQILRAGIEQDRADDAASAAALKLIALAESYVAAGDHANAITTVAEALASSSGDSIRVSAALVALEARDLELAQRMADELSVRLNTHSRAYSMMIEAALQRVAGEPVDAVYSLRAALDTADLWRIRYELGRTYLEAGFFAEAFDELETCRERRGEAAAMFLDDIPTFRELAQLPYWLARAQEGLGMRGAATENYQSFLMLRPQGGPLAEDASSRVQ